MGLRERFRRTVAAIVLLLTAGPCLTEPASSQTFTGIALSHRSSGSGVDSWTLSENGYVGTYIKLETPGQVTLTVNASGATSDAAAPRMNIVVADTKVEFDVVDGFNNYQHTFDLPAGTHFVRTEFSNDVPTASRQVTIGSLNVAGATSVSNTTNGATNNSNALDAANTYIENYRKGPARLTLGGVAPGTSVQVKLKRHDFTFGTAVGGTNNTNPSQTWTQPNNDPNSDAFKLQQAIIANFNSIVPGNAGKWQQNEFTRDSLFHPVLTNIFNLADQNDLGMRMHNLIWGPQQPSWVNTLLNNAQSLNPAIAAAAKADLREEISERIAYYIGDGVGSDWSDHYTEVDILNEFSHEPVYMNIFGAQGIADIYNEARAVVVASGNPVKLFTNEYNVLQWGEDPYGNWYREHVDELRNLGGHVDGIGVQYYVDDRTSSIGSNQHNAWRVMQTLQNLSVSGLDLALTEFGVNDGASEELASRFLDETMRLVFGNANSSGFTMWGFWEPDTFRPAAAFYDANWNPRLPLTTWQNLMDEWDTDLILPVGPDGTIDFQGFFGRYEITVDGQTFELDLTKGESLYSLVVAPGDYNGDGWVDAVDYTIWRDTLGSNHDLRADGNGNHNIDEGDFVIWKSLFGTSYANSGQASMPVPEPASGLLVFCATAVSVLSLRIRTNQSRPAT